MQKKVMEQVLVKLLYEDERIELALNEGRLDLLVEQAIKPVDIETMDSSIGDAKTALDKLAAGLPAAFSAAPTLTDYISGLTGALGMAQKAVAEIELDDPDGISNLAKKYFGQKSDVSGILRAASAVQAKVAALQDALEGGIAQVGKTLEKVVEPDDNEKPLKDVAGTGKVPEEEKLKTGIAKALKGAAPGKEGFLGKLMGFFSRGKGLEDAILGDVGELDVEALKDAIMDMSLKDLADAAGNFKNADIPAPPEGVAKAMAAAENEKADDKGGKVEDPEKKEKRPEFDLMKWAEKNHPEIFKKVTGAGMKADDETAKKIDKAVEVGKASPDDALAELEKEATGKEGAKAWKDVATAVAGAVEDKASAETVLNALAGTDNFKASLEDVVTFEEGYKPTHKRSLGMLLFEAESMSFEDLTNLGRIDKLGDDVDGQKVFADIAAALNKEIGEEIVTDIPEVGGEEGAPQSKKETEKTDAEAEAAAEAAADEAESANMSPGEGAKSIVGAWAEAGKTLSKNVSQKQRDILGKGLAGILDKAAESLAAEVEAAVDKWRSSQKVLQKPNVSDKQIDSLKGSLRDFVAAMVTSEGARTQSSESTKRLLIAKLGRFLIYEAGYSMYDLRGMSQRDLFDQFVNSYCNMHTRGFQRHGLINEALIAPSSLVNEAPPITEDELLMRRWLRAAGIDNGE